MAGRVDNFENNEVYKKSVEDVADLFSRVDVNDPGTNVINSDITTMQLLKVQAQAQAETLGVALEFIKNLVPLAETPDDAQLFAPQAGDKVSVQAQKTFLEELAKKNYLLTRMVQQRHTQKDAKASGSYFDATRDPICPIPARLYAGDVEQVGDSALKLLPSFNGDTNAEADNLKTFMRAIYDVAVTNRLSETCVKAVIKRKLGGTARRLIDSYEQEFEDETHLTLKELVLKLEDRYMSEWSPQIANAKLSMYTKSPNQTYQKLEGEISELTNLAARGEKQENRMSWIKQRKIAVFKQAVSEEDRNLLYRENQSRSITGIQEMNLSQMVDYLIKTYSETSAFTTANHLKNSPKASDNDSINLAVESQGKSKYQKRKNKKEAAKARKVTENDKIKDELFALYENRNFQTNNGRGGTGNRGFRKNYNNQGNRGNMNNFANKFNQKGGNPNGGNPNGGNYNNGNGNGSNGQKGNTRPRKFVTPDMVNVSPNSCLKCNSPTHRFTEQDKCIYGKGNLMTKACPNCKEGGHHFQICIKNQKQTIGGQEPQGLEPLDPKFSKWPEASKNVPEQKMYAQFPKNEWLPSLFPN